MPEALGFALLFNWLLLAALALDERRRAVARHDLGLPPLEKPPLGRYGWQFFIVAILAFVPLAMGAAFLIHLPLFAKQVEEIDQTSFHFHPPPRWVGGLYVEIDRCPHATFFIAPLRSNPIFPHATLVHRNNDATCEHVTGIPIWKNWQVNLHQGRGRDPRG